MHIDVWLKAATPWLLVVVAPITTAILGYLFGARTEVLKRQNAYRQKLNEERLKVYQILIDNIVGRSLLTFKGCEHLRLQHDIAVERLIPFFSSSVYSIVIDYLGVERKVIKDALAEGKGDHQLLEDERFHVAYLRFLTLMYEAIHLTEQRGETDVKMSESTLQICNKQYSKALTTAERQQQARKQVAESDTAGAKVPDTAPTGAQAISAESSSKG